ncbi:TPA: hypothetical protein ACI8B9_005186, partial [Escherichia coli]
TGCRCCTRTDWQQFARKRAEQCHRRCRGRV